MVSMMKILILIVQLLANKSILYIHNSSKQPSTDQRGSNSNGYLTATNERAKAFSKKWYKHYPHVEIFSNENEMSYYFYYLKFNYTIWQMINTTNWIEWFNKDIKQMTKIRNSLKSVESCLTMLS